MLYFVLLNFGDMHSARSQAHFLLNQFGHKLMFQKGSLAQSQKSAIRLKVRAAVPPQMFNEILGGYIHNTIDIDVTIWNHIYRF